MLTASATISRGRLQGNQYAHRDFLPVQHTAQVAHVLDAGLAAFDLNDDLLRLALRVLLLLDGPRIHQ